MPKAAQAARSARSARAATAAAPLVHLYPYQRKFLADDSRFLLAKFARQTGKTFTSTLKIAHEIIRAHAKDKPLDWVILSRGQRQSEQALRAMKNHLKVARVAYETESEDLGLFQGERQRADSVRLSEYVSVVALPANPDTARGFSANVLMDEFAFHQHPKQIWGSVFPIITRGNKRLIVISTPNGKGNKFYDLDTGGSEGVTWSRHSTNIYEAVEQGYPADVDALRAALADDDVWAQEYELKYIDDSSSWLTWDEIHYSEHADTTPHHYTGGPCFLGVDIAARRDLWVAFVLERDHNGRLWQRECIAKRRIKFSEQFDILRDLFSKYAIHRACYDQTGIGEKPVEDAQREFGAARNEGVIFTAPAKLDLATRLREWVADRRVRIAPDDALRRDLRSLKAETSNTGARRFVVSSAETDGHADRTWALALALRAGDLGETRYAYDGVPRHDIRSGKKSPDIDAMDDSKRPVRTRKFDGSSGGKIGGRGTSW